MRAKPWEVPDRLWQRIEPLLPRKPRRFCYPGRKALEDLRVLQGILFVLHTWDRLGALAAGAGLGCGMTAWRK
jgi:transposase